MDPASAMLILHGADVAKWTLTPDECESMFSGIPWNLEAHAPTDADIESCRNNEETEYVILAFRPPPPPSLARPIRRHSRTLAHASVVGLGLRSQASSGG